MTVLTLHGKAINFAKPPKSNELVQWSRRDMYGRKVIGTYRSIAHLDAADAAAKKKFGIGLVVIQPSYNTTVAASAGTHDFDACFDVYIPGVAWATQQRFFRSSGWGAYWRRPPKFGHHIHMFSLPLRKGKVRADDYREAGTKVGLYVDGGWSTRGKKVSSAQLDAYYNHRDALASNAHDPSWFPGDITKTIFDLTAYTKARAPHKPVKVVKPFVNQGFLNTWWNSKEGSHKENIDKTAPRFAKQSTAGGVGTASFSEVPTYGVQALDREMAVYGFRRVARDKGNMLVVYARASVTVLGVSFSKFTQQDGGNVEGVLRLKLKVNGSRTNLGVVHLDYNSSESKKRSNINEVYEAMRRWGATLPSDWKGRTVIIGDWNIRASFVEGILNPLGFKIMSGSARLDQAYTGLKRPDRGGKATEVKGTDHPHLRVRIGK
jgi:hypothetical protein